MYFVRSTVGRRTEISGRQVLCPERLAHLYDTRGCVDNNCFCIFLASYWITMNRNTLYDIAPGKY